jgi:hypothetical protein
MSTITIIALIALIVVGIVGLAILVGKWLDRDCSHCKGTGLLPPNGDEVDEQDLECPVCNGRGYLL